MGLHLVMVYYCAVDTGSAQTVQLSLEAAEQQSNTHEREQKPAALVIINSGMQMQAASCQHHACHMKGNPTTCMQMFSTCHSGAPVSKDSC